MKRLSVLHILPGIGFGGTEFVVWRLAWAERQRGINSHVLSLKGGGALVGQFRDGGIPLHEWNPRRGVMEFLPSAFQPTSSIGFSIIQGWLYPGNLVAAGWARARGGRGVIWNLMQANLSSNVNSWKTRLSLKCGARLSSASPDRIVCNSYAARDAHAAVGYDPQKMTVIPNGVDTDHFSPNATARESFRSAHNMADTDVLVGHLARWDPQKDHETLVRAFKRAALHNKNIRLILAGPGVTRENAVLARWIASTGVADRIHVLGAVSEPAEFLAALDVFCLSSVGESSPYALAEAMACGIPAITTDVGDCREMLGDAARVLAPQDVEGFARVMGILVNTARETRSRMGDDGRHRIIKNYSFKKMVDLYVNVYEEILSRRAAPSGPSGGAPCAE